MFWNSTLESLRFLYRTSRCCKFHPWVNFYRTIRIVFADIAQCYWLSLLLQFLANWHYETRFPHNTANCSRFFRDQLSIVLSMRATAKDPIPQDFFLLLLLLLLLILMQKFFKLSPLQRRRSPDKIQRLIRLSVHPQPPIAPAPIYRLKLLRCVGVLLHSAHDSFAWERRSNLVSIRNREAFSSEHR